MIGKYQLTPETGGKNNAGERRRKKIYGVKYLNLLNINAGDGYRRILIFSVVKCLKSLDLTPEKILYINIYISGLNRKYIFILDDQVFG